MNLLWHLGLRAVWRDARSAEVRLLLAAVVWAVAALCAVGLLADRLRGAMLTDAAQLLGGDAVLVADQPLAEHFEAQAQRLGLARAHAITFPTMVASADQTKLVALKAVDAGYPLRGRLQVQPVAAGQPQWVTVGPERGTVWVEAGVLDALGVAPGAMVQLGERALRIAAVLLQEPDRGLGFMAFAPRVMMHADDLPATALIQPASRVHYRLMVAGPGAAVARFSDWARVAVQARDVRGVRLDTLQSGRPEVSGNLDRALTFFQVVALLAALLCGLAVALAARSYARARLDDAALLRVLGVRQRDLLWAFVVRLSAISLVGSGVGLALGWLAQWGLVVAFDGLMAHRLPAPGWQPWALGAGVGLILVWGFGLPPLLQTAAVPPLRVLRRDLGSLRPAAALSAALGIAAFGALIGMVGAPPALVAVVLGGCALAALGYAGLTALLWQAMRWVLRGGAVAPVVQAAVRLWAARPWAVVVQVSSLALGLTVLLVLLVLRLELVDRWRASLPVNAPDRFVINILPDQAQDFQRVLSQAGVAQYDWYPMIRGRLVAINDLPVRPEAMDGERARRLLDREFNLSFSAELPAHNTLSAGRWQTGDPDAVSVEQGLADTLGLRLGDVLTFDLAGQQRRGAITSLRRVEWGSMHANFFVLWPRAELGDAAYTYMAALRTPAAGRLPQDLQRRFPAITQVDVRAALVQAQTLLNQVITAVQALFGLTLAAGLLVVVATVLLGREARSRELAVLRALGARQRLLRGLLLGEWLSVGALAGLLAATVAQVLVHVLAQRFFDFDLGWSVSLMGVGAIGGALLALGAGWLGARAVLHQPPWPVLRRLAVE